MVFLYPLFDIKFDLDQSSSYNTEKINIISTTCINIGRGAKQRKMRDSTLSNDYISELVHTRVLKLGDTQSMVFTNDNLPPIFDPDAPKIWPYNFWN